MKTCRYIEEFKSKLHIEKCICRPNFLVRQTFNEFGVGAFGFFFKISNGHDTP